jgi:hypothetical protein
MLTEGEADSSGSRALRRASKLAGPDGHQRTSRAYQVSPTARRASSQLV